MIKAALSIAHGSHRGGEVALEFGSRDPVVNGLVIAIRDEVVNAIRRQLIDLRFDELKARATATNFYDVFHIGTILTSLLGPCRRCEKGCLKIQIQKQMKPLQVHLHRVASTLLRMERQLDGNNLGPNEDWEGNNVAFTCPLCSKVFIVSRAPMIHGGRRSCPGCGKSEGWVDGGRKSGGKAGIRWSQ